MFTPKSVLALAAHPDDVEPQAGGTLAMWAEQGIPVTIATMVTSPPARIHEGEAAADALGVRYVPFQNYASENGYFNHSDMVAHIESWGTMNLSFDTIITPSEHDSHPDHRKVADLGYQLARRNRANLLQMSHAIPGGVASHPFPNLLVSLSPEMANRKWEAIQAYGKRLRPYYHDIQAREEYYACLLNDHLVVEGFTIVKMVNL